MLVRADIYGTYGGQLHMNVLHFYLDAATTAQYNLLGGLVRDFWCDTHRGNVDAHMSWQRVHIRDKAVSGQPEYDTTFSLTGVLGPSLIYIPFIAVLFKFNTAISGRRGHGRTFQGGYGQSNTFNSGLWVPSQQTRIENVAAALQADWCPGGVNTHGWSLQVAPRNERIIGLDVTSITASPVVTSMNSRKLGRGN